MGFIARAKVGQKVDVRKPGFVGHGEVIAVTGDVYKIRLEDGETKPIHHKFLTKLYPIPAPEQAVTQ